MNVQAWKCVVVRFAALSLLASLAACGTLQEQDFSPVQQGTKTSARFDRVGACFTDLDRAVPRPPRMPEDGEVQVGYENHFDRGADPFPCNRRTNYDYQAAVQFDTPVLAPGEVITGAVLQADLHLIFLGSFGIVGDICKNHLERLTAPWPPGDFRGAGGDPRAHVPGEDKGLWHIPDTARLEQDVSAIVRGWVDGSLPNQGLALAAPPEHSFAEESMSCVFSVRNWNLHVTKFVPDSP